MTQPYVATAFAEDPRLLQAVIAFEQIGKHNPQSLEVDGVRQPRQVGEAQVLLGFVLALDPKPSSALMLACHCQHLGRFNSLREEYPAGREGYRAWRVEAARRSAAEAARILTNLGFETEFVEAVSAIVTKRGRAQNPDVQAMEDALCLAFLTLDAEKFASRHSEPGNDSHRAAHLAQNVRPRTNLRVGPSPRPCRS
ncbi:MAG: DUF4202 family protein [Polyangiaceae bacterium]